MHPVVEELARVLPVIGSAGDNVDWGEVSVDWGVGFPGDFRDFTTLFGAGTIDNYIVIGTPVYSASKRGPARLRDLAPTGTGDEISDALPYTGRLIWWGGSTDAADFYWDVIGAEAEAWPVVVRSAEGEFTRFECGMAEFLLRMLGPRKQRPLESPRLYGVPNSRFLHWREDLSTPVTAESPWEYLEELYEMNELEEGLPDGGLVIFDDL
ncbi:hypothetical protein [Kitasatospora sp. NPDC101183]|uniref:hypothetical protein n=1 Tax=Kitasatospora sp. NPDC101183 TaxID=3364100 RepID=UPI00381E3721